MAQTQTAAITNLWDNPQGTNGFEFVEYCSDAPEALAGLFESLGFVAIAQHRSKITSS